MDCAESVVSTFVPDVKETSSIVSGFGSRVGDTTNSVVSGFSLNNGARLNGPARVACSSQDFDSSSSDSHEKNERTSTREIDSEGLEPEQRPTGRRGFGERGGCRRLVSTVSEFFTEPAFRNTQSGTAGFSHSVLARTLTWQRGEFRSHLLGFLRALNCFAVDTESESTHIWGQSRFSRENLRGASGNHARTDEIQKMVAGHAYNEEMKHQLRDDRVRLSYLDAFTSDGAISWHVVRVFSVGATLLEYLKVLLAVWTFFFALIVVAFKTVLEPLEEHTVFMRIDLCSDVLYGACLLLQLRTTVLEVQRGLEICDTRKIFWHNITDPFFWLDVVSCMPIVMLRSWNSYMPMIKGLRAWRIGRTPPEHLYVPSTFYTLIQLLLWVFMGGHLMACIWFYIVHEHDDVFMLHVGVKESYYEKCVSDPGKDSMSCFGKFYAVSLNMGVYLLMGIDKQSYSTPEFFMTTICTPFGCGMNAYILGKIILIIQRQGAIAQRQNERMREISEAMKVLELPQHLRMRMMSFFTYERIHRSGRLFHLLFADLSPQLRFELQLHLYLELICGSGLFRQARPCVVREIVGKLEDVIFIPGDWIARYGDYGDSMYFILSGEAVVIHKDTETYLKTLKRGSYFGEVALLTGVPRTAYVRANTFCIMARLTKEGFTPIVQRWPNEMDVLLNTVEKETDRAKIKLEASKHYGIRRSSAAAPKLELQRRTSNLKGADRRRRSLSEKMGDMLLRRTTTVHSLDEKEKPGLGLDGESSGRAEDEEEPSSPLKKVGLKASAGAPSGTIHLKLPLPDGSDRRSSRGSDTVWHQESVRTSLSSLPGLGEDSDCDRPRPVVDDAPPSVVERAWSSQRPVAEADETDESVSKGRPTTAPTTAPTNGDEVWTRPVAVADGEDSAAAFMSRTRSENTPFFGRTRSVEEVSTRRQSRMAEQDINFGRTRSVESMRRPSRLELDPEFSRTRTDGPIAVPLATLASQSMQVTPADDLVQVAQKAKVDLMFEEVMRQKKVMDTILEQLSVITTNIGDKRSDSAGGEHGESMRRAMQEVMQDFMEKDAIALGGRRESERSVRSMSGAAAAAGVGRRSSNFSTSTDFSVGDAEMGHGISTPFT